MKTTETGMETFDRIERFGDCGSHSGVGNRGM
jgi:hypothetical protein